MKKALFMLFNTVLSGAVLAQNFTSQDINRWHKQAKAVTIVRDNWGIPHVYGNTDADAVFGLMYAQCEDDFKRLEMNYIEKLGRMAEIKGENAIYDDLLIRMVIDADEAIADYKKAPSWLKKLLNAHADGINYYLYKNPTVKPALLRRFEPWYSLLWTDGSIGAINTADLTIRDLKMVYGHEKTGLRSDYKSETFGLGIINPEQWQEEILTGSNGFAFSPKITASGKSILYINPHVTFYFRPEVHLVSNEGLNVYGAVTWGQFFVYQGFNEKCGWIHTSSFTDISDTYIEKITQRADASGSSYTYENTERPLRTRNITINYLKNDQIIPQTIRAMFTHHGPIMAKRNGQWLSMKANNRSMTSLIQSWQRTKAHSFAEYKKTMNLKSNTSNNTVYADAEGNIAYWHGNFLPIRDTKYDWSKPVDGSSAATEWQGLHSVEASVHVYNPTNGWLQNCNATPFTVAGSESPRRDDYPKYMAPDGENFRGLNAVRVLSQQKNYTIDKVIAAGYDGYMSAFEILIPALTRAYDQIPVTDSLHATLAEPMALFKKWDYYANTQSLQTTLAVEWGQRIQMAILATNSGSNEKTDQVQKARYFAQNAPPEVLIEPLVAVINELKTKFGRWQVPWGEINRFQRISSDIDQKYDDNKPSLPVGFTSSAWGTLPSYTARYFAGTQKRYGVNGNSFVCVVEFGDKIKAKSLLAGGQSGNAASPHFADQAQMYTQGQFKEVLFYKEDVLKKAERTYKPGEF
jgi:acyl-homoserine-lactone acylase